MQLLVLPWGSCLPELEIQASQLPEKQSLELEILERRSPEQRSQGPRKQAKRSLVMPLLAMTWESCSPGLEI